MTRVAIMKQLSRSTITHVMSTSHADGHHRPSISTIVRPCSSPSNPHHAPHRVASRQTQDRLIKMSRTSLPPALPASPSIPISASHQNQHPNPSPLPIFTWIFSLQNRQHFLTAAPTHTLTWSSCCVALKGGVCNLSEMRDCNPPRARAPYQRQSHS